jgi:hypothetical protein
MEKCDNCGKYFQPEMLSDFVSKDLFNMIEAKLVFNDLDKNHPEKSKLCLHCRLGFAKEFCVRILSEVK